MSLTQGSVWSMCRDRRFNRFGRHAPAYLTKLQACRWERIAQARMLYNGDHYTYYICEQRTQYKFPEVQIDSGEVVKFYLTYNLLRRISNTSATLLFGREPLIRIEDEIQGDKLRKLAARSDLQALLIDTEIECSFAGEAVLEVCLMDGEVYVVQIPAEQIHPLGLLRADRQFAAYVRYAEENVGTEDSPIPLILKTVYREGSIERWLYQGTVSDTNRVRLDEWPAFKAAGKVPPDVETTGIPFNTIVWVPNMTIAGIAISDYDGGLLDQQDTLNAKRTQLSRVISKHSDPKVIAPRSAADENGNLRADREVLYADNSTDWRYLTWEAQLAAATKDLEKAEDEMCVTSETAPVLLGIERGGVPDSAAAMRIRANPSLSKAERKAALRRPVLVWLLTLAQYLEQTIPGNRYSINAEPSVEPRDGLPTDDMVLSQTIANLVVADSISLERRVELQISDPVAAQQEVERIRKEIAEKAAANTPSVFMGEPPVSTQDNSQSADGASSEAA